MARAAIPASTARQRLSRERVLQAAIAHADAGGLEALTMRQLAEMLDVAPMALYRHVANKDDLIDAMIDVVFGEIGLPSGGADWRTAMRERALSLCDVLARHHWAVGLMESRRSPGPANLRHHDAVIGKLRAAGLSADLVASGSPRKRFDKASKMGAGSLVSFSIRDGTELLNVRGEAKTDIERLIG